MTTAASPPVDELSSVLTPYLSLLDALRQGATLDAERTRLVEAAVDTWSRPGFDTFLSQPKLGFEPFDYQWQTAQTVLRRMRGQAILADDVLPAHGLPLTLRCLAAWWLISDRPSSRPGPGPACSSLPSTG
jgi:hypothetical protein